VQFQELTDHLDVLRKLTGIRIQEQYNTLLRNGWTLGATQLLRVLQATIRVFHRPLVKLLAGHFRNSDADLLGLRDSTFQSGNCRSVETGTPGQSIRHLDHRHCGFPTAFLDSNPAENQYVICGRRRRRNRHGQSGRMPRIFSRLQG